MLIDLAPIDQTASARDARVSLWVDPGTSSAVLKFGFIRTSLFLAGFISRALIDKRIFFVGPGECY